MSVRYTHKGWIGLCPVFIANPNAVTPDVEPRYPLTDWLLSFSLWMFDLVGSFMQDDSGAIPIRITGRIDGMGGWE